MECVDQLNEHFLDLVVVENGRHVAPRKPGYSVEMRPESLDGFEFPNGRVWSS